MPCYRPLDGWWSSSVNESGKRSVVFNPKDAYLDLPIQVPCGQCIGCRLEKARQWAVRLTHEAQAHTYRWFITLTYDDDHIPPHGSLRKKDFQDFMKRLRKRSGAKIRYLHCGEYGDLDLRPHYHAVIFGVDFPDRRRISDSQSGRPQWRSDLLAAIWGHGFCTISDFSYEAAGYVARYVLKKQTGDAGDEAYTKLDPSTGELIELERPYVTMSLKPAIAQDFYDKFGDDISGKDCVVIAGKEALPPKRYSKLFEERDPEGFARIKAKRAKQRAQQKANSTPERLAVREEVKLAAIQSLKRS